MRKISAILFCLSIVALAGAAVAGDPRKEAADRFDHGLRLFNEGDNTGALLEFKRAYELSGESSILVNVGLVYAEMRRPVEAVDALDKALAQPAGIPEAQVERGRRVRDEQNARIGRLLVTTNVPAQIEIDNLVVGRTPLAAPIAMASGIRLLAVVAPGQVPVHQEVAISGGQQAEVAIDLLPLQGELAHLVVTTTLPGADVLVDGKLVGHTPLPASVSLPPGHHEVSLRRPGYRALPRDITLADGSTGEITIEAVENPDETALVSGQIELDINQADANVAIDGVARSDFHGGLSLAAGPHRLSVTRAGFLPFERELTVDKGLSKTVRISLQPKQELRNAQSRRRRNAWITVGAGAVVAGVGGYLIWQAHKDQRSADATYTEVSPSLQLGGSCYLVVKGDPAYSGCQDKIDRVNSMQDHANRMKWIAWSTTGVGAAVIVTGVILHIVANDTDNVTVAAGPRLQPFAWAEPQGGGLGVFGRF